jgi:hypothetical protein
LSPPPSHVIFLHGLLMLLGMHHILTTPFVLLTTHTFHPQWATQMLSISFSTCIAQHLSCSLSCITSESLHSLSHALSSMHLPSPPSLPPPSTTSPLTLC